MRALPPFLFAGFLSLTLLAASAAAQAASPKIVIKTDAFQPKALTVAAGTRVKITVANQSGLPAEFEGKDFSVEKVIPAGTTLPVYIGPLEAGTYHFFNEFSPSATGTLTAK
ncbi:cupredoxin domain-containing protein [Salinisphaera sp.]|uniref:cupredoxin domain-containing protein n=1 Tax=Salinisphaera sp. TaxID=1914330 RepID=UPI002D7A2184|nr:cupredoxin domain-containing protein [Salinisphaera sp.]HET7315094.1 cupredoxin domain-containing protein [Salinisphaera sp.]